MWAHVADNRFHFASAELPGRLGHRRLCADGPPDGVSGERATGRQRARMRQEVKVGRLDIPWPCFKRFDSIRLWFNVKRFDSIRLYKYCERCYSIRFCSMISKCSHDSIRFDYFHFDWLRFDSIRLIRLVRFWCGSIISIVPIRTHLYTLLHIGAEYYTSAHTSSHQHTIFHTNTQQHTIIPTLFST